MKHQQSHFFCKIMKKLIQLIACFFLLIPAASVFIRDPSFSSSSEEGYGRGKHHHGGHHSPTPNPCEVGWYAFHRPQGVWCVKVRFLVCKFFFQFSIKKTLIFMKIKNFEKKLLQIWIVKLRDEVIQKKIKY